MTPGQCNHEQDSEGPAVGYAAHPSHHPTCSPTPVKTLLPAHAGGESDVGEQSSSGPQPANVEKPKPTWVEPPDVTRRTALAVCCLAIVAAGCAGLGPTGASTHNGTVTHVVDGDTIEVRLGDGSTETVRLLGVDAPETGFEPDPTEYEGVPNTTAGRRCLRAAAENASAYLRAQVAGERVRVETDPTADRRGDFGRLLAYIHAGERNLNYALVADGHARVFTTTFSERERFEAAAATARADGRGVWRCRDP